jgi:hypothetical protein
VIGKISPRGARVSGLIYYLYGPGRNEEHTDPHIVAGWRHPAELEPPLRSDGRRDFRRLKGLLQQSHAALGPRGFGRPVWHSVRAAPEDRMLSDDEWAQIACEIMHRTGLAPYGQDDDAVRWVAVRHADDHIHLVAMLARQDGTRPPVLERLLSRRGGLPGGGGTIRAAAHRAAGSHGSEAAVSRGVGEGTAPQLPGTSPHHAQAGSHHRGGWRVQRAGVLRQAGKGQRAGPQTVQHPQPRRGHWVCRRLAW